jgi:hypothetical protein
VALADAILETSSLGIVIANRAGQIVRANSRLERMFGYTRSELAGLPLETLLPERLRASHVEHRADFFADPRMRPMGLGLDLMGRRKDGRDLPVEVSLTFIEAEEGLLALAFVSDISPRKAAEKSLQAEFAVTRVFSEATPIEDLSPRLLQALCENLGWHLGELWQIDGDVLRRAASWHPEGLDTAAFDAASREVTFPLGVGLPGRVWATGASLWAEDVLRDAGFLRTSAAVSLGARSACAFPIRSEQQVSSVILLLSREVEDPDEALLTMLTDIGRRIGQHLELRRTAQELARQREVLYQSEKLAALGRLVAGVAHEMNNTQGNIS